MKEMRETKEEDGMKRNVWANGRRLDLSTGIGFG